MQSIYSVEALQKSLHKGLKPKYIFFWGHRQKTNHIDKSCFSQWYPAKFEIAGQIFLTAEHYMMAEKARLFNDEQSYQLILAVKSAAHAKALGREVKDFNEIVWQENRFNIVVNANLAKFSQNPALKEFLLNTGQRILVEASPVDKIWGIGLAEDHEFAKLPVKWRGLNLLGFALMKVRDQLKSQMV